MHLAHGGELAHLDIVEADPKALLDRDEQVGRIEAVEVQIVTKPGIGIDLPRFDLELLDEDAVELLDDHLRRLHAILASKRVHNSSFG